MILPKEIKTRHKIRDMKIVRLWSQDLKTMEEISQRFEITRSRVQQIIYANRDLLRRDKNFEKSKRLVELERMYLKAPDSQKDKADILDQVRKEYDGDGNTNFIQQFFSLSPDSKIKNRLNENLVEK